MNSVIEAGDAKVALDAAVPRMVSLKTLARRLDCHPTSVRRWLTEAGIQPRAFGSGPKGGIRYALNEVEEWLSNRALVR